MRKLILTLLLPSITTLAAAQGSMNMSLLYHWEDTTLIPSAFHNNAYNEIWGYTKNGEEYAIIGTSAGTHIFDVTDPVNSSQVEFIAGEVQGSQIVHRDYHDYAGYLYMVCDEGPSTLQIADLSFLPDSAPVVYDSNSLFHRSHNIFIDSTTAKLYVCGGNGQLSVYSLANPENPTLLVNCELFVPFWNNSVGYVHDIYVRNDTAWCNAEDGLYVVDFTNTTSPVLLGSLTNYVQSGYNHSGWLHDDGTTYALADETHGMDIKILDVSDLTDMQLIDTIGVDIHPLSIPHNLIYKGNYLYVSYYKDGTYIFDASDPANMFVAGYYDTSTETHGSLDYRGNWGIYPFLPSGILLASDMQEGLFVFDIQNAVGMEEVAIQQPARTFPNPFTDQIHLRHLLLQQANYTIELTNISGQVLYSENVTLGGLQEHIIRTPESLPTGIYFVRMQYDNTQYVEKLIKVN